MKAASIKEIKSALESTSPNRLLEICLRLIKFKNENKELATYLLFDETDEAAYVTNVKTHITELFEDVNTSNLYFAKKTLRKIVRLTAKFIRYSGEATTEAELWLDVAEKFTQLQLPLHKNAALQNMYTSLIKKIKKAVQGMHEDLQYDYLRQLAAIEKAHSKK
ncbi:MAG: hypothetical protein EOO03_08495 [Chitinophagaceae bacterium]|nr:MAG: hypothetical protein EOO03_08495 [Chitinophagaceae bacterium]